MLWGVLTPATTSSPWAFIKYSPNNLGSPFTGLLLKATPVPELLFLLP